MKMSRAKDIKERKIINIMEEKSSTKKSPTI